MSTYEQGKSFRLGEGFSVHIRTLPKSSGAQGTWFVYKGPFVNNEWYGSSEASTPAKAKSEAREALAYTLSRFPETRRDAGSRRSSSNANPLSGPRKDARDHAIAKAVAAARRSGEDYSVWMDKQGRFYVDQAGAAPWESTIAVAHETTGHLSYKRYENKAPKTKARSRDPVSEHRAHPTLYKVSVRYKGSDRPLRTWGPFSKEETQITLHRSEA